MGKKSTQEDRMEVGDDGKLIKVYIEEEVKNQEEIEDETVKINFFNEIRRTEYPDKSQFKAIVLSAFGGMIFLHDFYLGTKNRALIKGVLFAVAAVMSYILFAQVANETAISYNIFFQAIMLLPLILYFLAWSYDFMTLAAKKSTHFKIMPVKEKKEKSKKKNK